MVGHCGDPEYLSSLAELPCEDDHLCEDLLLGQECCFDIAGGVQHLEEGQTKAGINEMLVSRCIGGS